MIKLLQFERLITNQFFSLEKSTSQDENGHFYRLVEPDSVLIIPFDRMGNVYLVEQLRPAMVERTLEFPAGAVCKDEMPSLAASREVLEETGMKCHTLMAVSGALYCLPNRVKSKLYVYVALVENSEIDFTLVETCLRVCERQVLRADILSGLFRQVAGLGGLYLANNFFGFDILSVERKTLVGAFEKVRQS